jgi:hypothetical protein
MPFEHGKGTVFKLDNSGGTLTDISSYLNNVDFSREIDTPESTVFGLDDRTYIAGLRTATFSLAGFWEAANLDALVGTILGQAAALEFEYGPGGSTSGDIKYTGSCFCTNYSVSNPVDGIVSFTADFQISGAVTRGTYS